MFKKVLKLLSVCLSVAILLSALMLPMGTSLTVFADESTLTTDNLVGTNYWTAMLQTANSETGGVRFTFTNAFRNIRLGFTNEAKLDGLNLKVANIVKTAQLDPIVSFVIANSKYAEISGTGYFILTLDTESGELQLIRNKAMDDIVTIIHDDKLLYSNVTGKTLLITASWQEGGSYGFNVEIGADNVSGSLSADDLAKATTFDSDGTAYLTITPGVAQGAGKDQSFSFDVIQFYSNAPSSSAAVSVYRAISAIGNVNLEKGYIIRNARSLYDALSEEDKAAVSNYSVLTDAEAEYIRLSNEADSGLVIMNTQLARFTQAKAYGDTGFNGNLGAIVITDNSNGGVHVNLPRDNGLVGNIEAYASNVNLDGVKLRFDNFVTNDGSYTAGQMAVLFGNGEQGLPSFKDSLALVFNPNTGTLYAIYGAGTSAANIDANPIIKSELLKGANFEHRRFSLSLKSNPDDIVTDDNGNTHNGFIVTVEISGQTLTGVIPYSGGFENISSKIWATDNVTVALSLATPYGNGGTRGYTVDWIGVDEGVVDGKNGNYELNSDNTAVNDALLDQNYVLLKNSTGSVEFTVQTDKAEVRLMGYSNSSSLNVYIDGELTKTLAINKFKDKWYTLFEDLDPNVEHTVKLENAHSSLVSLNGVYINLVGDINNDGSVNSTDLTVMRKYLLGIENSGIVLSRADLSGNDGVVDLRDLIHLKKILAGSITYINNSDLLPAYYTTMANDVDSDNVPNWTDDLIIGEVNLRTATSQGTIQAATKVLDHYAEMGVNGVWITPVFDGGVSGNGYGNLGIDTIDPSLTGTTDYAEGWAVLKTFIDEAHSRNIRVILDVVFRGVQKDSPLYGAHQNWFTEDTQYGNYRFLWEDTSVNSEIAAWYVENIVSIAKNTGCDGFRYDMMPSTVSKCNITVEKNIVDALHKAGCYLFIMSESVNNRNGLYATETVSINEALSYEYYKNPYDLFLGKYDIADFINSGSTALNGAGAYKYYTYSLANHDFKTTGVNGSRIAVGYQAIFSPFIPVIFLGEEWNNPHNSANQYDSALYYNTIDWSALNNDKNRAFYEDVKMMIRIRRTYSDLFNIDAAQFKDSNICKLATSGAGVSAYARYAGNRAALIVPNNTEITASVNITVSLADLGLNSYNSFTVTDVETGSVIASRTAADIEKLTVSVNKKDQRVLIITGE